MLKAGTLPYALFISLLLTLLTSSLFSFFYIYNKYYTRLENIQHLNDNVNSSYTIFFNSPEKFEYGKTKKLFLFNDTLSAVYLTRKQWGGYEIVISQARWTKQTVKKIALCGTEWQPKNKYAIYLTDNNNYLSIGGNTKIIGDCYVPGAYIKPGVIHGKGIAFKNAVQGKLFNSSPNLPVADKAVIDFHKMLFSYSNTDKDSIANVNDESLTKLSINRSFMEKTLVFYSENKIAVEDCNLKGNIMIKSEESISVESTAMLENIIVSAPIIHVKRNFEGEIQLFATDSIDIEDNCKLNYPSYLCAIGNNKTSIYIGMRTEMHGGILHLATDRTNQKKSKITIKKNAEIYGIIYSNALSEIKGKLRGSIISDYFHYQTKSAIYENFLLDCTINSSELSDFFISPLILQEAKQRRLITWLD